MVGGLAKRRTWLECQSRQDRERIIRMCKEMGLFSKHMSEEEMYLEFEESIIKMLPLNVDPLSSMEHIITDCAISDRKKRLWLIHNSSEKAIQRILTKGIEKGFFNPNSTPYEQSLKFYEEVICTTGKKQNYYSRFDQVLDERYKVIPDNIMTMEEYREYSSKHGAPHISRSHIPGTADARSMAPSGSPIREKIEEPPPPRITQRELMSFVAQASELDLFPPSVANMTNKIDYLSGILSIDKSTPEEVGHKFAALMQRLQESKIQRQKDYQAQMEREKEEERNRRYKENQEKLRLKHEEEVRQEKLAEFKQAMSKIDNHIGYQLNLLMRKIANIFITKKK